MGKKTPLYEQHQQAGAKIVDFAGWDMPLHYGSQLEEHHKVRKDAGVFDVSHMTVVDIHGSEAKAYLRHVLANDVGKLKQTGKALYSCMLNEQGGIVDDLIVYYLDPQFYRLVVNSSTRAKDLAWLEKQVKGFSLQLQARTDLAILAIQGPRAREKVSAVMSMEQQRIAVALEPFHCALHNEWLIARTGYTGEEGFEVILPPAAAITLWQGLLSVGVHPCGLGARDTLRLEAGMSLYGSDMDETTTPLESNLTWTVAWEPSDREFIGRSALETQRRQGVKRSLVGLVLEEKGVLRNHQKIWVSGLSEGEITSGSFSPTLGFSIALARVPAGTKDKCQVEIRGKQIPVQVVTPPFVRHGQKVFKPVS